MSELGISALNGVSGLSGVLEAAAKTASTQEEGSDFASVLAKALEEYREVDNNGDYASLDLLTGDVDDLSAALITTEKAEIALNLTVAIRNKAVEAYKEVMGMQI